MSAPAAVVLARDARAAMLALARELEGMPAYARQLRGWAEMIVRWPNVVRFDIRAAAGGVLKLPHATAVLDRLARGERLALEVCATRSTARAGEYSLTLVSGAP